MNSTALAIRKQTILAILCGLIILGVLICTLWPLDPYPGNQVTWLEGSNGIRFGSHGVLLSKGPLQVDASEGNPACVLELFIRPADDDRVYTIISFYTRHTRLDVKQWKRDLLVLLTTTRAATSPKTTKLDVNGAFERGKVVLVTISANPNGTDVFLNGRKAKSEPGFVMSKADLSGDIVIGTSAVDYQPWHGEVHGLAVYTGAVTPSEALRHYEGWTGRGTNPTTIKSASAYYVFSEGAGRKATSLGSSGPSLDIPSHFTIPFKPRLQSPFSEFRPTRKYLRLSVVNIVGFLPVGFLFCAYLQVSWVRQRASVAAIVSAALLSLIVEVLQIYIPQRGSNVADIITNTTGGALGAMVARVFMTSGKADDAASS